MSAKPILYYWEDLSPGQVREYGTISATVEEIKSFAGQFDPQPFHLDEDAARESLFGALCASGWHTCSMAMRLMVDNFLSQAASLGSPGLDKIRWLKPVYPGDVLRLRQTVAECRPMSNRPTVGLVRTSWEMFNHRDEQVLQMEGWGMFRRRWPAPPPKVVSTTPDNN